MIWTLETIYRDPQPGLSLTPQASDINRNPEHYTDAYIKALRDDTMRELEVPKIPAHIVDADDISSRCTVCKLKGEVARVFRGRTTGVEWSNGTIQCRCVGLSRFNIRWQERVPERFRSVRLDTLQPSTAGGGTELPLERQAEIISHLQSHPRDSYLFTGEAGRGKTHFAYALYAHALWDWSVNANHYNGLLAPLTVWVSTASDLAVANSRGAQDPTRRGALVTSEIVHRNVRPGQRLFLFLDEVDRVGVTEARMEYLNSLINAVYSRNGQIVATSNLSLEQLGDRWGTYGDPILRRFACPPAGNVVDFNRNAGSR